MDAKLSSNEQAYNQIRAIAARTKSVAQGYRAALNSDLPVKTLVNIHKGLKHLKTVISGLYSPSVSGLSAAIKAYEGVPSYDLLADLQSMNALVDAINTEVVSLAPISPDGSVKERTFTADGEEDILIPVASLVALQAAFDNLIADIQA